MYPGLMKRIIAMLLDSVAFGVLLLTLIITSIELGLTDNTLAMVLVISPLFLFEPLFVSLTGGSLGHHYTGIKVTDGKTGGNLNLYKSILRTLFKLPLGAFSFLSMWITQKHGSTSDCVGKFQRFTPLG